MFDPLHKWLGIPPSEQPPNDYRLLGLVTFEDDPEVIDAAADRDMTFLHNLTNGEHGELAEELSNRLSAARLRLLNKDRKAAYDEQLKAEQDQDQENVDIDSLINSLDEEYKQEDSSASPDSASVPTGADSSAIVLGVPPGVSIPTQSAAPPPSIPPEQPASEPVGHSPSPVAQPSIRAGSSEVPRRRKNNSLIWIFGIAPGVLVLGYLLLSLATGRLQLDQDKLETLGVSPDRAAMLAGNSTTDGDQEKKPGASKPNQPVRSSSPSSSDRPPFAEPPNRPSQFDRTGAQAFPSNPSYRPGSLPSNPSSGASTSPSMAPSARPSTPASKPPTKPTPNQPITPPRSPSLAEYLGPTGKRPIPSAKSIEQKMDTVRDLYEKSYLSAETSDEKIGIANQMRDAAIETSDDPEGKFALFRVARDIYVRQGEFASAIAIIDLLDESFDDVDTLRLKKEILVGIDAPGTKSVEFTDVTLELAADCLSDARLDDGVELCEMLREKVQRIPSTQMLPLKDLEQRLVDAKSLFDRYERSAMILETNPDDAGSETIAGMYLCLVEGRWSDGLPRLASGADPSYRDAAISELELEKSKVSPLQVADLWYEIMEAAESALEKRSLADHAKIHYQAARPESSGLEIRKIDQRLSLLNSFATPGPITSSRIRAAKRAAEAKAKLDARARAIAAKPKVLQTRTWDSPSYTTDFAAIQGYTLRVGMGNRSPGWGEAAAGFEFENVGTVGVQGVASHTTMTTPSPSSKLGFFIDYHTDSGYSKRVFLNCGQNSPSSFYPNPPWGTSKLPDQREALPNSTRYSIDLEKWAPSDWDGKCWFTVYMQNAGINRLLTATLSWKPRSNTGEAE